MAIAMRQAASYDQLLNLNLLAAQGWTQVRSAVLSQVPVGTSSGRILIPTQADAFEWDDVSLFGVALSEDAVRKLQAYIQAGGSQLHAYALFQRTKFNILGLKVTSYRLLLYHSIVQLGAAAIVIMVAAFAALLYIQYIATGQPPVQAIQNLWGGIVKPVQDGVTGVVGTATGGISTAWILAIIGSGAIAIAFGQASKATGTKVTPPKGPGGSLGVRAGGVSGRVST